jgi:peptidyl-prolyl cis-trans isomerase B (cyclophilin B)
VDLAKAFPNLWKSKRAEVLYVQLLSDGKSAGPALVLQPMVNPPVVTLDATTKNPVWSPDEDNTYAGIRCWVDQNVVMDTEFGEAEFKMRPDCAPNTVWNFVQLIQGGYYRDVIFHRIINKHQKTGKPFVIQTGDPTGTGSGSPGYSFILEKSSLIHDFGVLGMARSTDPNTNGSQFYVALSREATQHLDGKYATYGQLVRGKEVIEKIAAVAIGPKDDRPVKPPIIKSIRLVNPKDH